MKVAIAVIYDKNDRILITRRPLHTSHGGLWEFPGGKVELNENPTEALIREMREEVGLEIHNAEFMGQIHHHYPHHSVELLVYSVREFSGVAVACEMQMDLRWVDQNTLNEFDFPEANYKVIQLITTDKSPILY